MDGEDEDVDVESIDVAPGEVEVLLHVRDGEQPPRFYFNIYY